MVARNLWISAGHIAGKCNVEPDQESRQTHTATEWMLQKKLLAHALDQLKFTPEIDLFATLINCQFPQYVAYRPDPEAVAIDAFSIPWSGLKFYAFPSFSVIPSLLKKIQEDQAEGVCVLPSWLTTVVPKSNANGHEITGQAKSMHDAAVSAKPTGTDTPLTQQAGPLNMPLVRKTLNTKNLSSSAKEIIMASWHPGTGKQYHSYLGRWEKFCAQKAIVVEDANIENGVDFLPSLYEDGLGYSAINTARSALSSVLTSPGNVSFGNHPLVSRFLKGVFELKPSLPRYHRIWDVSVILRHLKNLEPVNALDLKVLRS